MIIVVSIHAPVMDANTKSLYLDNFKKVSIHAPVMDAKISPISIVILHIVSIHAPVMDAKVEKLKAAFDLLFQSTRP